LTLNATASRFTLARTGATGDALFLFGSAFVVVQFIQFHVAYSFAGTALAATAGANAADG
jgi:hypothetical protein